ncbi:FAD protein [Venustampulla echinocandica]|uniref:FAD protein n=1 Tax=Venustampulla echinocandica TaxID=2656787 RepID=A0A370TB10_9HELO|nr:FAD protein [Venustampulla echinocandica]RDL31130.1 FAD protein [Venustampulla echinocandica]
MNIITNTLKRSRHIARSNPLSNQASRRCISIKDLDASKGGKKAYRERVVILGSGWAGFVLSRELDKNKFQTVVVSPTSYFAFTPLLASTAVGTLEFRTTLESVRGRSTSVEFFQGWADDVNFNKKKLFVEEGAQRRKPSSRSSGDSTNVEDPSKPSLEKGQVFDLQYDKLVVAVGCYSQTFSTPGVRENAFFLKDVTDAIRIRRRILECFEIAALPTTSDKLRDQLLSFAIVGGGPTGVEFAAELFDLCHQDLKKLYPSLIQHVTITIYDVAPKILPMFDSKLADYAVELFRRDGIKIKTEYHIQGLRPGLPGFSSSRDGGCYTLKTKQDGETGIGMCVWSTGLMMNPFIQHALDDVHTYPAASATLSQPLSSPPESMKWYLKRHPKTGGLVVDDHFRVKLTPRNNTSPKESSKPPEATMNDIFALGDVSAFEKAQLPATAQVASQEAKWLAKTLNKGNMNTEGFDFKNMGVLTYLGNMRAIMQGEHGTELKG